MYKVSAWFRNGHKVSKVFDNVLDAIDFRDNADAHYPIKVVFEKGVYPVRSFIVNCWNGVMDYRHNPLSNIPDMNVRHMVLQVLAWMWCIIFAFNVGSWVAFGVSAIGHVLFIAGIAITVGTFETARRKPTYFGGLGRGNGGEHE